MIALWQLRWCGGVSSVGEGGMMHISGIRKNEMKKKEKKTRSYVHNF